MAETCSSLSRNLQNAHLAMREGQGIPNGYCASLIHRCDVMRGCDIGMTVGCANEGAGGSERTVDSFDVYLIMGEPVKFYGCHLEVLGAR